MKKKVLFITNIPSPYRIDFFNELGKLVDLTVVFEARRIHGISFNWNDSDLGFKAVFLSSGEINEKRVDFSILHYIKKKSYDYIFVTNYAYYTEMAALLKIKMRGIPYIMEIDGAVFREESKLKFAFKKLLISGARYYFSPSYSSDKVLMHYGAKKDRLVRYPFSSIKEEMVLEEPVPYDRKEELRRKLEIKEDKVVITVGQFIHRKGNDVLLSAIKNIDSNIGFYFIGGKPTEDYFRLVKKKDENRVHFIDFQSKESLVEYYQAADLFVFPTREDVWGLVVNEAMSQGLPVITTTGCVAGVELVKENGVLVPVEDEGALTEAIQYCLDDPKHLYDMSKMSIKIIRKYTIEKMVSAHYEFIEKNIIQE